MCAPNNERPMERLEKRPSCAIMRWARLCSPLLLPPATDGYRRDGYFIFLPTYPVILYLRWGLSSFIFSLFSLSFDLAASVRRQIYNLGLSLFRPLQIFTSCDFISILFSPQDSTTQNRTLKKFFYVRLVGERTASSRTFLKLTRNKKKLRAAINVKIKIKQRGDI